MGLWICAKTWLPVIPAVGRPDMIRAVKNMRPSMTVAMNISSTNPVLPAGMSHPVKTTGSMIPMSIPC